jgi:transposase
VRGLIGKSAHIDTTTLLLHGELMKAVKLAEKIKRLPGELTEQVNKSPTPALGRSKAHRDDLKQVMMSFTVSGPASMPLWFESLPRNSSDKTSFHDSIAAFEAFKSHINFTDDLLWVADSALYCKEKLKVAPFKWLTRIPHTKGNAQMLVRLADSQID